MTGIAKRQSSFEYRELSQKGLSIDMRRTNSSGDQDIPLNQMTIEDGDEDTSGGGDEDLPLNQMTIEDGNEDASGSGNEDIPLKQAAIEDANEDASA
jgi:hypothetical protein